MNKHQLKLENTIKNMQHSPARNFLYYIIAPLAVLLIGIILFCTVGFNYGVDFTGGSTVMVYVNNDSIYQDATTYDLDASEDYAIVCDKIASVLADANCTLVSCQTTKMDIYEDGVYGGMAVKIVYQNSTSDKDAIAIQNDAIRDRIITNFEYQSHQNAVSTIETVAPQYSFNWLAGLLAGALFALLACAVYFAFRFGFYSALLTILQVSLDASVTLALLAICRITMNMNSAVILLVSVAFSLLNIFLFLNRTRDSVNGGRFVKMRNTQMADTTTKELAVKKGIMYITLLLASIVFVAVATAGVRMIALGTILTLVVTFYTSNFVLGGIWAVVYRPKKVKKQL